MTSPGLPCLDICSAGAARAWIEQCIALPPWAQRARYSTRFAALHNTLDEVHRRLLEGWPCQLAVLTPHAAQDLQQQWPAQVEWLGSLGRAETGWVALASDLQAYDVSTPEALRRTLMTLDALLVPDLVASSGGRHLHQVLQQLNIPAGDMPAMVSCPGGAQAVAALPEHAGRRVLACAQSTEVQGQGHARYLGPFPAPHDLSTEYGVSLIRPSSDSDGPSADLSHLAREFGLYLCDPRYQAHRGRLGFESAPATRPTTP